MCIVVRIGVRVIARLVVKIRSGWQLEICGVDGVCSLILGPFAPSAASFGAVQEVDAVEGMIGTIGGIRE